MLVTLLAGLFVEGAATRAPEGLRFDGVYESGFEISAFTPCNGEGVRFWVAPGPLSPKLDADIKRRMEQGGVARGVLRYRVTLVGLLSEPGRWGHLGMYARELTVTKVENFRAVSPEDLSSEINHCAGREQ